jgi:hypothetical protein
MADAGFIPLMQIAAIGVRGFAKFRAGGTDRRQSQRAQHPDATSRSLLAVQAKYVLERGLIGGPMVYGGGGNGVGDQNHSHSGPPGLNKYLGAVSDIRSGPLGLTKKK